MGDRRLDRLEVRTFKSEAEVRELIGFKQRNPLSKTNYKELIGDYEFAEKAQCCFQPEGREFCGKWHNIGYVVRLQDGSVTIIGNICATNNFDAEAQISQDRAKYQNEKKRLESLARVQELVGNKAQNMERLRTKRDALKLTQERLSGFLSNVGTQCAGKLLAMARDGRRDVLITGVRIRPYVEDGEKRQERTKIPLTVGSLRGLNVLRADACQGVFDRMYAVARAYDAAEKLEEPMRNRDLEEIRAVLSDVDRIFMEVDELTSTEESFFSNDFSSLPFLVADIGERARLARFLLKEGGKQRAKEWLQEMEAALRTAHGVNKLEW